MRVAVPTAVHHSRDRCFGADAAPPEGVRDIHDTEFFEMSFKMSTVSPLDVSSEYETGARADGVFVRQFSEGAGEGERVTRRTVEHCDDGLGGMQERNSGSLVLDAWSEVFFFFLETIHFEVERCCRRRTLLLSIIRESCVVSESLGSFTLREVCRRGQYVYNDVNKFNEAQWSQSVTNGEWVELIQCIYQSVVCTELVSLLIGQHVCWWCQGGLRRLYRSQRHGTVQAMKERTLFGLHGTKSRW